MTRAYIVVEGPADAQILRALLDETLLKDVKFINGEGKYGAETMARSLLLDRHIPVLLVIDADTTNPEAIHSYQQDLEFLPVALRWALLTRFCRPSLPLRPFSSKTETSSSSLSVASSPT